MRQARRKSVIACIQRDGAGEVTSVNVLHLWKGARSRSTSASLRRCLPSSRSRARPRWSRRSRRPATPRSARSTWRPAPLPSTFSSAGPTPSYRNLAFGEVSPYLDLPAGRDLIDVASGGQRIATFEVNLEPGRSYSAVVLADRTLTFDDRIDTLRIVHAAPDLGPVDVLDLGGGAPLATGLTYGKSWSSAPPATRSRSPQARIRWASTSTATTNPTSTSRFRIWPKAPSPTSSRSPISTASPPSSCSSPTA